MVASVTGGQWECLSTRCWLVSEKFWICVCYCFSTVCCDWLEWDECLQVIHRSTPILWWGPTVRLWTIRTLSTFLMMLRSLKKPKTLSVPSLQTGEHLCVVFHMDDQLPAFMYLLMCLPMCLWLVGRFAWVEVA